jgi:hypothetical protein
MRTALPNMVVNTGSSSLGDLEMTLSTSEVADNCSTVSSRSRVSRATSVSLLEAERRRLRAAFGAASRFALIVFFAFAGLRLVARRRLTWPSLSERPQPSTAWAIAG